MRLMFVVCLLLGCAGRTGDGRPADAAARAGDAGIDAPLGQADRPGADAPVDQADRPRMVATFDGGPICPTVMSPAMGGTECTTPYVNLQCVYRDGQGCAEVFTCQCAGVAAGCHWSQARPDCPLPGDGGADGVARADASAGSADSGGLLGSFVQESDCTSPFPPFVAHDTFQARGCGNPFGPQELEPVSVIDSEEELAQALAKHECLRQSLGFNRQIFFDTRRLIVVGVPSTVIFLSEIEDALVLGLQSSQGPAPATWPYPVLSVPRSDKPVHVRYCYIPPNCSTGRCPP
jgi:hypothetical protein